MGALGDPYALTWELRDYCQIEDSIDDLLVDQLGDVASRQVEQYTGRQFNKTTSASARKFRPADWRRVPTDDFHTSTGLAVTADGVTVNVANLELRPWNNVYEGQSGWPFHDLYGINYTFTWGATVEVTAQWGWTAVPAAIKQATLIQAARLFRRRYSPSGLQSVGQGDFVFRVSTITDPDVQQLLDPYRLRRLVLA